MTPLQIYIKIARQALGLSKRKFGKTPKWLFPDTVWREYYRSLKQDYTKPIKDAVNAYLIPELTNIVDTASLFTPDNAEAIRKDASSYPQMIEEAIFAVNQSLDATWVPPDALVARIAFQTSQFNKKQWLKIIRRVFGVDVFLDEPWLQAEMLSFAKENVALIKSIRVKSVTDIEGVIFRGVRSGRRSEDIAREIKKKYSVTNNRAKLIARDQVGKFNGQLTRLRQLDAGVRAFKWSTAADERVRPRHAMLEGRVFNWHEPPDVGFPGEPIQCRCIGEPLFRGFDRILEG